MRSLLRPDTGIALALALVVAGLAPPPGSAATKVVSPTASTAKPRPVAPEIQLVDLEGKPVRLSEHRGKVVLVDFWATWCGPCRRAIPHLKSLHAKYAKQGFVILGLSVDHEGPGVVRDFVKKNAIPWRTAMADERTMAAYGEIRYVPTAFLIDREGRLVERWQGNVPEATLEKALRPLL